MALAVLVGVATFPLVLVFGPVYFPWTIPVLGCFGGVVGLSLPRGTRSLPLRALGFAGLTVAAMLAVFGLTSNMVFNPSTVPFALIWSGGILVAIFLGVLCGARLKAGIGMARGAAVGAAAALVVALFGVVLAFVAAPAEIAGAPACAAGTDCLRNQCAYMAERRRILAIERVIAFDGQRITCSYTAWGGIDIGQAEMGRGGGSWSDGMWPRLWRGGGS